MRPPCCRLPAGHTTRCCCRRCCCCFHWRCYCWNRRRRCQDNSGLLHHQGAMNPSSYGRPLPTALALVRCARHMLRAMVACIACGAGHEADTFGWSLLWRQENPCRIATALLHRHARLPASASAKLRFTQTTPGNSVQILSSVNPCGPKSLGSLSTRSCSLCIQQEHQQALKSSCAAFTRCRLVSAASQASCASAQGVPGSALCSNECCCGE